jgi:hypothetical protein
VPFVAILASAGLYSVGSRLAAPDRPFWPVALLCLITCLGVGKMVFDGRDDANWPAEEKLARKVNEVTPPGAMLLADEPTYFVTRHPPYPGAELADSHKISLPTAVAKQLHLLPKAELNRLIQAGTFDTIEIETEDKRIEDLGLKNMYTKHEEVGENTVFWGKAK